MIPKIRTPGLKEYMIGYTISSFSANSPSMDVFIPAIMTDKTATSKPLSIPIHKTMFVSKENIVVSQLFTDLNYVSIKVSDLFKRHHREISYAYESNINYRYDTFPTGSKVKIYIPDLDFKEAIIVPFS